MPRKPRMYLSGVPAHIVQRGNNRNACFFKEADYHYYLDSLDKGLRRYNVALHAYALMGNHVHLLMTPENEIGISQLMQHLGRQYVCYFNKSYKRTGTLWEGRHKGSLVSVEDYLLNCYRYIELNPVVANMVGSAEEYPWSSYAHNALGQKNKLITEHSVYLRLGLTIEECQSEYNELIKSKKLTNDVIKKIEKCSEFNYPLGNEQFIHKIEFELGHEIGKEQRGRPKKRVPV